MQKAVRRYRTLQLVAIVIRADKNMNGRLGVEWGRILVYSSRVPSTWRADERLGDVLLTYAKERRCDVVAKANSGSRWQSAAVYSRGGRRGNARLKLEIDARSCSGHLGRHTYVNTKPWGLPRLSIAQLVRLPSLILPSAILTDSDITPLFSHVNPLCSRPVRRGILRGPQALQTQ